MFRSGSGCLPLCQNPVARCQVDQGPGGIILATACLSNGVRVQVHKFRCLDGKDVDPAEMALKNVKTQTRQMDKRRATQQKKTSTILQSLLWHCRHPAHMGVCGLHASLWGSLNHQHSIVGYWAVLGLKRCECPLVLGYYVWGYVKFIHIQIARQMILLAWGSLFKLAPGANTQLHWVNAWTHQHVLDASIEGFLPRWHVLSDGYPHHVVTNVQNHSILGWCFRSPWHLALGAAPISAPFSVPTRSPPEDRSRVSCHSAIWMPNTWKRLATPKLRKQTDSKSQRERWKMLKTLKGSCWYPFYDFFPKDIPKEKTWWTCSSMFQFRSPPRIRRHEFQLYVAAGGVCSHHRPCAQEIRYRLLRTHMDRKPAQRSVIETSQHIKFNGSFTRFIWRWAPTECKTSQNFKGFCVFDLHCVVRCCKYVL